MSRQMAKQLGDLMGDIEEAPAVSADDLSAWLGEPISEQADVQRAESVISFAFTLINKECGRSNAYWAAEGLPQDVRNVALQVAARGFQNPDSWANERLDDWGAGGRPVEELGMYLTATEKRIRIIPAYAGSTLGDPRIAKETIAYLVKLDSLAA